MCFVQIVDLVGRDFNIRLVQFSGFVASARPLSVDPDITSASCGSRDTASPAARVIVTDAY
jgi:hypothetical protein